MKRPKILLDEPHGFFRKMKPNLSSSVKYFLAMLSVFIVLNELSIRAGITEYIPKAGPIESVIINYFSLLAGFFLLAVLVFLLLLMQETKKMNGKLAEVICILAYSTTPVMLFGWIPFSVIQAITILWSLAFLAIGIKTRLKLGNRPAIISILALVILMIILSVTFNNYIISIIPSLS